MNRKLLVDIAERTAFTYLEVFLGIVIADAFTDGLVDMTVLQTAAVSALPAALAVVKGMIASRAVGDPDSASASAEVTNA
jgi:hypothetical protein